MATTDPTTATVRGYFEALRDGDAAQLARHTLPHPELATLVARPPSPTAARHLAALDALSVRTAELPRDRLLVQAWLPARSGAGCSHRCDWLPECCRW